MKNVKKHLLIFFQSHFWSYVVFDFFKVSFMDLEKPEYSSNFFQNDHICVSREKKWWRYFASVEKSTRGNLVDEEHLIGSIHAKYILKMYVLCWWLIICRSDRTEEVIEGLKDQREIQDIEKICIRVNICRHISSSTFLFLRHLFFCKKRSRWRVLCRIISVSTNGVFDVC